MRLVIVLATFLCSASLQAQDANAGSLAQEVALRSVTGDTLQLSSLKGKVVLVDFWASWCGPCRVTNRNMVALYTKYKNQGFEIFGISLDNDRDKWKTAITTDKISWLQVNQPGAWDAPVAMAWDIEKLPASFLLNQDGVIVAVDPSYGVLSKWLEDLLANKKETK